MTSDLGNDAPFKSAVSPAQRVRALIVDDRLQDALTFLRDLPEFRSVEAEDDLTLLESRLKALEVERRRMTLPVEHLEAQRQQIREQILNLISRVRDQYSHAPHVTSQTPEDLKARDRYLKDLRRHVENLLNASIHNVVFLDLGIDDSPSATHLPWLYRSVDTTRNFSNIAEAFEAYEGRLLLLGSPGGGKTTTLQHLALRLIAEAESNSSAPLPLLVNLSKFRPEAKDSGVGWRSLWKPQQDGNRSFETWLIGEMESLYRIKRSIAKRWITGGHMAILLDGLDEVNDDRRAAVARLLNETYLLHYPESVVVVCSRTAEYQPLQADKRNRLQLRGAVTLQSLTYPQVQHYLDKAGARGLRDALDREASLYELAESPLTLSMMVLAYGSLTAVEISSISASGSGADQRHRLMEYFVARMIQRKERKIRGIPFDNDKDNEVRESDYAYSTRSVDKYLSWLAIQLSTRMQTSFALSGLFNFLQRKTEASSGFGFVQWSVRGVEALYVLVLMLLVITPLALRGAAGLGATVTILSIFFVVSLVLTPLERYSEKQWAANLIPLSFIGVAVVGFSGLSRTFHAFSPGAATAVSLGATFFLTWVGLVIVLFGTPEDRRFKARVSLIALLVCSPLAATAVALHGRWTAEFLALSAALFCIVIAATDFHLDQSDDSPWQSVVLFSAILIGLLAAMAGWSWLLGPLGVPEAIGVMAVALGLVLINAQEMALVTLVAFSAAAIGAIGGLNAAFTNAAVVFCLLALVYLAEGREGIKGRPWVVRHENWNKEISRIVERLFLSPAVRAFLIVGCRLPIRVRRFLSHSAQALLLKPTGAEIEFVHRRLRDYFALRELIPRLQERDSVSRLDIIRALGFQGAAAIEALVEIIGTGGPLERAAATTALGRIASPEIAHHLKAALNDPDYEVRYAAVPGIRRLGGDERLNLLIQASRDTAPQVRLAVLEAAVSDDLRPHAERLVEALVGGVVSDFDLLRASISKMPEGLCRFLGRQLSAQSRKDVLGFLSDPHPSIRVNACHLISGNEDLADFDLVSRLFETDKDATVRAAAATAFAWMSDRRAATLLLRGLTDPDDKVRQQCAWALRYVRPEGEPRALVDACNDRNWSVRAEAVRAIGALGCRDAGEQVMQRIRDANRKVRIAALETAGAMRHQPARNQLQRKLRSWQPTERSAAVQALGQFEDLELVPALVRALADKNAAVRVSAAAALGRLEGPVVVAALKTRYEVEIEGSVKDAIVAAIQSINDEASQQWLEQRFHVNPRAR
jgi:HEAT repeat protein